MIEAANTIIISRTDSIGDVILTLPVAGVLRQLYPDSKLLFLGRTYTKPIIEACSHINSFINWDEILDKDSESRVADFKRLNADVIIHVFPHLEIAKVAKKAGIPYRIGTTGRYFHWLFCNKLIPFSRKNSEFHEAQLNLKLIEGLGAKKEYTLEEISSLYGLKAHKNPNQTMHNMMDDSKFNLILHPKSKGSTREWGIDKFEELIDLLPKGKFKIFITGTDEEGAMIKGLLVDKKDAVIDMTGKLSLEELITFISIVDGVIAASTGPLHIAAALGKLALGIYPPIKPMHPTRWKPLGANANYLVVDKKCNACRKSDICKCIMEISPYDVLEAIQRSLKYKNKMNN